MTDVPDPVSAPEMESGLKTSYLGRPLVHLPSVDSTQNMVAEAGRRGEHHGLGCRIPSTETPVTRNAVVTITTTESR